MGYDLTRFVGEIDEEFQCSICSMVFQNPVQTSCEHTFCNECIRTWLSHNTTCPVDRKPLSQSELKSPGKLVLNLLAKLKMKCGFDQEGCDEVVKLEHLQDHLASCKCNPNLEIICDKGCNMKTRLREYDSHNCVALLADRISHQEDEIRNLTSSLTIQQARSICQEHDITRLIRQEKEIKKLKEMVSRGQEQNTELIIEMRRLKEQVSRQNDVVSCQQENIPKVGDDSAVSLNTISKWRWRVWKNDRFLEQTSILECERYPGIAQSYCPLGLNSTFKVEILRVWGDIVVGLSPAGELNAIFDLADANSNSMSCDSGGAFFRFGRMNLDGIPKFTVVVGDIIECGIKCPQNFSEDDATYAAYFSKNGKFAFEKVVKLRPDQLYPTVCCYGRGTKVKIISN